MAEVIGHTVALAKYPNVSVKLSNLPNSSLEPYPFNDLTPHIKRVFDAYGPQRCHWGTDTTNGQHRGTWRQRLTHFTETIDFMSESDKDWVLGRSHPAEAQMGLRRIAHQREKKLTSLHIGRIRVLRLGGQGRNPADRSRHGRRRKRTTRQARNSGNCSRPRTARRPCSTTRRRRPPCGSGRKNCGRRGWRARLPRRLLRPRRLRPRRRPPRQRKAKPKPLSDWLSDQKKDGRD